jgi:hypothetical protein
VESQEELVSLRVAILQLFPLAKDWLDWWSQVTASSMIGVNQTVSEEVSSTIPDTTNPIKLHHHLVVLLCEGGDFLILEGTRQL